MLHFLLARAFNLRSYKEKKETERHILKCDKINAQIANDFRAQLTTFTHTSDDCECNWIDTLWCYCVYRLHWYPWMLLLLLLLFWTLFFYPFRLSNNSRFFSNTRCHMPFIFIIFGDFFHYIFLLLLFLILEIAFNFQRIKWNHSKTEQDDVN